MARQDLEFGEWFRREIEDEIFVERSGFFVDQIARVSERLQADRPVGERFRVLILWSPVPNAFTTPGRYVYINRRLLERCPNDASVAFIVAHEIAHHDLGHLSMVHGPITQALTALGMGPLALVAYRAVTSRLYGPEQECDADKHAMKLCLQAGYKPHECLRFFHVLEQFALDFGDVDAVYGLDLDSDEELSPTAGLMTRVGIWMYQRRRGYLPIRDREAEVRRYLAPPSGDEAPAEDPRELGRPTLERLVA